MNKKKLSVVMAGAMLATSVAPVLAATESSVPVNQKELLKKSLESKMESAETVDETDFATFLDKVVDADVKAEAAHYDSLYGVKVLDNNGKAIKINDGLENREIVFTKTGLTNALNEAKKGYTIEIHKITNASTLYGKNIVSTLPKINENKPVIRYEKSDINTPSMTSPFVESMDKVTQDEEAKITYKKLNDINDPSSKKVEYVKVGDQKLDVDIPLDKDGNLLDGNESSNIQKFDHFEKEYVWNKGSKIDVETTVEESIKITESTDISGNENLSIDDLYDGYVLTAKGTELSTELKNAKDKANGVANNALVKIDSSTAEEGSGTGIYKFEIKYYLRQSDANSNTNEFKTIAVRDTDNTKLENLRALIASGEYKVGVIGGDNRYETAVNVSKAQGITNFAAGKQAGQQNIVLVNGESLVDGLAAAPLASKLGCYDASADSKKVNAPVLLTSSDSLSKATEKYLTELTENIAPASLENVTINLVGGKSVLTSSLEKELRDKGFTVVRYGGDDREETSLKVAEKIGATNAFVVGGNGEADAMSIASVASDETTQTPIIVSGVHGLSEDAINYIDTKVTGNVTVIGGESVVSKEEEAKINEVLDSSVVRRIAGNNRFETNAKIISAFYDDNAKGAVVVKDGQSNKSELIDALSAANYAASIDAPIVLASNTLKDSQSTALLNLKMSSKEKVMQVGQGAARDLLEKVAKLLDVSNL